MKQNENSKKNIKKVVNGNTEVKVFSDPTAIQDIDLNDEKIQKAVIKPPTFDFYYGNQEYGLDFVDLVKNGFSNHITNILVLYEKARIYYYTNPNFKDARMAFHTIKGTFR